MEQGKEGAGEDKSSDKTDRRWDETGNMQKDVLGKKQDGTERRWIEQGKDGKRQGKNGF